MVRSWLLAALLALALAASGCITSTNMTEGDTQPEAPPEPVLMSDTATYSESVSGPRVSPQEGAVAGPWAFEAPEDLQSLKASLTWTSEQNEFRLRVTTPSGETLTRSSSGQNITFAPTDAASGTYTFEVITTGLVVADDIGLAVAYSWLEHLTGSVPDPKETTDQIQYTQDGNKWRATIVYTTKESGADDLTLDVDTFNGPIDLASTTGAAQATIKAWARADTKERAAELVEAVSVTLGIEGKTLTARAADESDRSGSESAGASVDIQVPGIVSGSVDTSNGGITFSDIETSGLSADTSNGGITGDITASGALAIDTSNGAIDLDLTPTKSLSLELDTSNGGIDLRLPEGSDIGYRLEADTSNGRISESMDEASLSGEEDDTTRTLETDSFATRAMKIIGNVDTSNGNVDFVGA